MELTHPPKSSSIQIELREAVFAMICERPGILIHDLHAEINKKIPHTFGQFRHALTHLRESECVSSVTTQTRSSPTKREQFTRYFPYAFEEIHITVPASSAMPLQCASIPETPLPHAAYWLHILSLPGVPA